MKAVTVLYIMELIVSAILVAVLNVVGIYVSWWISALALGTFVLGMFASTIAVVHREARRHPG